LETRGQPEESTGSPLDRKSRGGLPYVLLGYKESNIGLYGGIDPLQSEKTAHRGAPAPTTTERK
jgi:hypothetical protein